MNPHLRFACFSKILSHLLYRLSCMNLWQTSLFIFIHTLWKQSALSCLLLFSLLHIGYGGLAAIFLLISSFIAFLRFVENSLLYHTEEPANSRYYVERPSNYHLNHYESIYFFSESYRLHSYLIKCPYPGGYHNLPTILFCHGNAGNIGHRLLNINHLVLHCHVNVMIFDYRGFGLSKGLPSEHGLYEDARSCLRYLLTRTDINHQKIILFGRSLGGAVAIQLASESQQLSHAIRALIVENTFTSLPDVGKNIFNIPLLRSIPDCLLLNQYHSVAKMNLITKPVLFVSGSYDTLVPPDMMMTLFQLCASSKKQIRCFPSGHNDTWTCSNYTHTIRSFIFEVFTQTILSDNSSNDVPDNVVIEM